MTIQLVDKLYQEQTLSKSELLALLNGLDTQSARYLFSSAYQRRFQVYQNSVFVRGLIEFSNYCKNPCMYCGISCHNNKVSRYRMSKEEILLAASSGYDLGFRTFVLQGGEDPFFTDDVFLDIVSSLRKKFPDAAITLSIGERSKESYRGLYLAGANRFLLRHECINPKLYAALHPGMSLSNRLQCLLDLKEIGYQVGSGFMVGVPGQKMEDLVDDLLFLKKLNPQMVGIGPFLPHNDTPLKGNMAGSAELTYRLLAIIRLLLPNALIPATTSLATLKAENRYQGFRAGANVVMPNLTPYQYKKEYQLYNGKRITDTESMEALEQLKMETEKEGFFLDMGRGDYKNILL